MTNPKINITLESSDYLTEAIGIIGLLLLFALPLYYYNILPDQIPSHYGVGGKPDAYSGKGIIWLFPILGSILYLSLTWLNRYPHKFNYPQEITIQNAQSLYTKVTKMMRLLKTIITCTFAFVTYSTIQTALDNQSGLGKFFIPVFILIMFGTIGYFLFTATSKSNPK